MKRKVYGWILLGLGILCLVSCDEGRIYEAVPATAEGGRTVKFTGKERVWIPGLPDIR